MARLVIGLVLAWFITHPVLSQRSRIRDYNTIGWYVYNGDHQLGQRWQLHTEYQWRRIEFIKYWQQSLARIGVAYQLRDGIKVAAGYTYFITFPYGEHPVADQGVATKEHRLYQDVQWAEMIGCLMLSHRVRLEQRWLGQVAERNSRQIEGWEFQNRIRYQLQADLPLQGTTLDDQEFYLTFFDELFIGFGRNVGDNVFNQNRILGGLGYQVSDGFQIELGYLNQITQHAEGDPLTGKPIFEINNGFRLNVNYSLDFTGQ